MIYLQRMHEMCFDGTMREERVENSFVHMVRGKHHIIVVQSSRMMMEKMLELSDYLYMNDGVTSTCN